MTRVGVLGCGPAGLLAAQAAEECGAKVTIYTKIQPSFIHGAQFLHRPIPRATRLRPDGFVHVIYRGTQDEYAKKIYGDPDAPTSWGRYVGKIPIWSMQDTYENLWLNWLMRMREMDMSNPYHLGEALEENDCVVSTIPKKVICLYPHEHRFDSQAVYITRESDVPPNIILYNGKGDRPWYRSSNIFGNLGTEYPEPAVGHSIAISGESTKIWKPLRNTCDCWEAILKTGRYGAWEKDQLAHHAYEETLKMMG